VANPWLKKNPLMSMWLSAANAAAGSLRAQAVDHLKRQAATTMTRATKDMLGVWTAGMASPPAKPKRRTRR